MKTYQHQTTAGSIALPWPRGSKEANSYFQRQREKHNLHPGESFKVQEPRPRLMRAIGTGTYAAESPQEEIARKRRKR
jgi:hypothetical protein